MKIAPSISDDSTADKKLNKLLFSSEEAAESFLDCEINDLLCPLPDFTSIPINIHSGRPQNLFNDKHWHPLQLFKLFFNWETMSLIVKETNSYTFWTNSAKKPWKSLTISELYQFFDCLIRLGLFKHPLHLYSWSSHGVLAQVPLSKNCFESILRNFHFKNRGFTPEKGHWWDKLKPIFLYFARKMFFLLIIFYKSHC